MTPTAVSIPATRQRGLSLVELLVGLALGLAIVAATTVLVAGQLRDSRRLLLGGRLVQDLRTAADLVARDLRRAGYWSGAARHVWHPGGPSPLANPFTELEPATAAAHAAAFRYSRNGDDMVDADEQFGFQLHEGTIRMKIGHGSWQAMTDASTLVVDDFRITPSVESIELGALCRQPCPAASATCPPRQRVRSLEIAIAGHAAADAATARSVRTRVRLRNDPVVGRCPGVAP